jgi:hypothetical protein
MFTSHMDKKIALTFFLTSLSLYIFTYVIMLNKLNALEIQTKYKRVIV